MARCREIEGRANEGYEVMATRNDVRLWDGLGVIGLYSARKST
jgi:hypothetical protein